MAIEDTLILDVRSVLNTAWNDRDGQVVPSSDTVALSDGAVKMNLTILYADLADSTELAMYDRKMTARIYKAFLLCSSKIIKDAGGEIRSFDGDRVMGVFIGNSKNTSAVKCALKINYAFLKIIKPAFEEKYEVLRNGTLKLAHCVGVDTSDVLVIRGGVRYDNDLLWVGEAPNVAAKLSGIRNSPYHSYITEGVYNRLDAEVKISNGKNMWEKMEDYWKGVKGINVVYRSYWMWMP
jgi:adenylate cyclase